MALVEFETGIGLFGEIREIFANVMTETRRVSSGRVSVQSRGGTHVSPSESRPAANILDFEPSLETTGGLETQQPGETPAQVGPRSWFESSLLRYFGGIKMIEYGAPIEIIESLTKVNKALKRRVHARKQYELWSDAVAVTAQGHESALAEYNELLSRWDGENTITPREELPGKPQE